MLVRSIVLSCLETPRSGRGTGPRWGSASPGLHVLGSLGAEALHDPVPLHAIKEEEVVVGRVPLRQRLRRRTGPQRQCGMQEKRNRKSLTQIFCKQRGQTVLHRPRSLLRGHVAVCGAVSVMSLCSGPWHSCALGRILWPL